MARRTKEDALETRNQILDAAEQVFEQRGVARTSLAELAEAAGVTRGAIYWHFRDKAAVFDAMMARMLLPFEVESATAADDDPFERMRRQLDAALCRIVGDHRMQRVIEIALHKVEYVDEFAVLHHRRMAARARRVEQLTAEFETARCRGRLCAEAVPQEAAIGLVALIDGLVQQWMAQRNAFDLVAVGRRTVERYLAGFAAPQPTGAARPARRPAISPQ